MVEKITQDVARDLVVVNQQNSPNARLRCEPTKLTEERVAIHGLGQEEARADGDCGLRFVMNARDYQRQVRRALHAASEESPMF